MVFSATNTIVCVVPCLFFDTMVGMKIDSTQSRNSDGVCECDKKGYSIGIYGCRCLNGKTSMSECNEYDYL